MNEGILSQLYKTDFELKNISVIKQKWIVGSVFEMSRPRPVNGIIYLKDCSGTYILKNGQRIYADKNSIVWLTEQSRYICVNTGAGNSEVDAYLLQFNMEKDGKRIILSDSPFLVNAGNNYSILTQMKKAASLYEAVIRSPAELKSSVYGIISALGRVNIKKPGKRFESILKGIEYMEKNPVNKISIEQIAQMCNVSSATFRRLFKEYSGKSPVEFRIDKQIEMAKNMLSGENMTLAEISYNLDIDNVPYFCRLFREKTSMTPTEYKNRLVKQNLT